jgi:hypothetical protein
MQLFLSKGCVPTGLAALTVVHAMNPSVVNPILHALLLLVLLLLLLEFGAMDRLHPRPTFQAPGVFDLRVKNTARG